MAEEWVAIKCMNCGAKLDVPRRSVAVNPGGPVMFLGTNIATCEHCGTKHRSGKDHETILFDDNRTVTVRGNVTGIINTGDVSGSLTVVTDTGTVSVGKAPVPKKT